MHNLHASALNLEHAVEDEIVREWSIVNAFMHSPAASAVIALLLFFVLGVWYYTADEGFTFINALYFIVVVLTTVRRSARETRRGAPKATERKPLAACRGAHTRTHTHTHTHSVRDSQVGYGDLGPKTARGKLITCVFVLYAMVMAAQALGILTAAAIEKAEKLQAAAKQRQKEEKRLEKQMLRDGTLHHVNVSDHKQRKLEKAAERRRERNMKRLRSVRNMCVVVAIGTIYYACDPVEHKSWVNAFYMSVITVTTVGFGDKYPISPRGRLFAVFYIAIGTLVVGSALSTFVDMYLEAVSELNMRRKLDEKLDAKAFLEADDDGTGQVSEAEFVMYKLEAMELVSQDTLQEIVEQFRAVDIDGDGVLTRRTRNADAGLSRTGRLLIRRFRLSLAAYAY